MTSFVSRILILAFAGMFLAAPARALSGDAEAVAQARKVIELMGGKDVWSKAAWFYVQEEAEFARRAQPAVAEFWRSTRMPAEWGWVRSPEFDRRWGWSEKAGWQVLDGTRTEYSRERLQQVHGWWPGEIYVIYYRFAIDDPALRLSKTGERSFAVLDDRSGRSLGEFFLGADGSVRRWRHGYGTGSVDYVYGPLKSFGPIKMPDWGALADGSFRFYYRDARLTAEPPAEVAKEIGLAG